MTYGVGMIWKTEEALLCSWRKRIQLLLVYLRFRPKVLRMTVRTASFYITMIKTKALNYPGLQSISQFKINRAKVLTSFLDIYYGGYRNAPRDCPTLVPLSLASRLLRLGDFLLLFASSEIWMSCTDTRSQYRQLISKASY